MTQRFMTMDGQPGDVQLALELAEAKAKNDKAIVEIVFFMPSLKDFRSTTLAGALGEQLSKMLAKGEGATFHGVPARVTSDSRFARPNKSALVMVLYADRKMMNRIDECVDVHTVITVPHVPGAVDAWKTAWSPHLLGQPQAPAPAAGAGPVKDDVVVKALDDLTSRVNLSNAALGARDRAHAQEVLKSLRHLEHHLEAPANLRAWAISNGWRPKAADELERMATKVFSTKGKPKLPQDAIERARQNWL